MPTCSTTPGRRARAAGSAVSWRGSAVTTFAWRGRAFDVGSEYEVVFTDGEQVGLPFAALCRLTRRAPAPRDDRSPAVGEQEGPAPPACSAAARHRPRDRLRRAQRDVAVDTLGYRPEQVVLTPFMVDTEFWRPERGRRRIRAPADDLRRRPGAP